MRRRLTGAIVCASLAACTLTTDFNGYTTGPATVKDGGSAPLKKDGGLDAAKPAPAEGGVTAHLDGGVDARVASCSDTLLVGNKTEAGAEPDGIGGHSLDTYGYAAEQDGTADCIWIFIESVPSSVPHLGVYSHKPDNGPQALLGKAAIPTPVQGWQVLELDRSIPIARGTVYWIGITPIEGGIEVREHENGGCGELHMVSGGSTDTDVPDPFGGWAPYNDSCDMLAYLSPKK